MTSKRLIFALVVLLLLFGIYDRYNAYARVLRRQKNNFSVEKIVAANKKQAQKVVLQPLKLSVEEANAILAQPFFYLAKGKQCVAFQSNDGRYVLKFMKKPRAKGDGPKAESKKLRQERLQKSFEIAVLKAPDECGILFAHLSNTKGVHPDVTILDKRGNLMQVPVNDVQFILQEKVVFLKPILMSLMYEGRENEAKQKIDALFNVLLSLAKKGIEDSDGALIRNNNIGFLQDRAIILDPGKFELFRNPLTEKEFIHSLRRLQPLQKWLSKHYPTLALHFEEARQEALQSFR